MNIGVEKTISNKQKEQDKDTSVMQSDMQSVKIKSKDTKKSFADNVTNMMDRGEETP